MLTKWHTHQDIQEAERGLYALRWTADPLLLHQALDISYVDDQVVSRRQLCLHVCTVCTHPSLLPVQPRSGVISPITNADYAAKCYAAGSLGHWTHCLLFPHKKTMTVSAVSWSPFHQGFFHTQQARTDPWQKYNIRSTGFSSTSGRTLSYASRLMSLANAEASAAAGR